MAEPDMTVEAGRVKASIKQAVSNLIGDPAGEVQGLEKDPQQNSKKTNTTKSESGKVIKE